VRAGVRSIEHGTYLTDTTLALMKQRGTFFVPTYSTVVDLSEPGGDYDNPALRIRGQAMVPYIRRAVRRAHQMGVKIATGSDTESGPTSTVRIPQEIVRLVELGFTPLEAIQSATTVAAELLGVERRTGSIRDGLEADLIVVGGNPLEDITALEDVQIVISSGRVALNRLPFGKE
jgi:imidazolonepropionase-like amidohydrolase